MVFRALEGSNMTTKRRASTNWIIHSGGRVLMTELPIVAGQILRDDERRLGRFTAAKQLSEPLESKHPSVTCAEQLRRKKYMFNILLIHSSIRESSRISQ